MKNDEINPTPQEDQPSDPFDGFEDDLRYAPPVENINELGSEQVASLSSDAGASSAVLIQDPESSVEVSGDSLPVTVTDGLDIEAALAAVSTLSDVVAEQEAVEQTRLARIEFEAQAKAERQARLENPERYFPVPPMLTLKRGQMASVIPALLLIGIGAWLTFSATSLRSLPDVNLLLTMLLIGFGLTFLSRWLMSRRWARGVLFFGIVGILSGAVYFATLQPGMPTFAQVWPLIITILGIAVFITGMIAIPKQIQLTFPALILAIAGLAGTSLTLNLLPNDIVGFAASIWPIALLIVVLVWIVPLVFRQRQ